MQSGLIPPDSSSTAYSRSGLGHTVKVGAVRSLTLRARTITTAICKEPVDGRIAANGNQRRRRRTTRPHGPRWPPVDRAPPSRFASGSGDLGVHASVCPCGGRVERDRIEGRLDELKALLSARSLGRVLGRVGTGSELCKRDRRDRDLCRERMTVVQLR
jgi:hypothetical protein